MDMTTIMDGPLAAYWVRFFKGAGFGSDVATRHAMVFSSNRIQPDMLADLDKPSLREMGITLMGDMIAILRHAKKVVEDTTCERFLVDSKDLVPATKTQSATTVTSKKLITKVAPKPVTKSQIQAPAKKVVSKTVTQKKKITPTISTEKTKPQTIKRKLAMDTIEINDDSDDGKYVDTRKRLKTTSSYKYNVQDVEILPGDNVGYKVIMPKGTTLRSQAILKKAAEQKRTVFDRLGDSSVTSTTSSTEGSTTFNITGLGKTMCKRTTNNVFNRLGDRDSKKEEQPYAGILKNGNSASSHGILKNNRGSTLVSTTISLKKSTPAVTPTISRGTMRADFERKTVKKTVSTGVKQLVTSTKLASERMNKQVSAKQRLGTSKQVTFNKIKKVAVIGKSDVFSRLGI